MGELVIDDLRKVFDDGEREIVAVDDVSLEIEDGEFLILVGPSGCGKSTTLRCVAGLESVSDGRILLDGEDITSQGPTDRDMAMVFQSYALYPHMTARGNMAFGLKMQTDRSKAEIDEQVEATAEMMGIESLLEKKPKELSGGQQQRVALGRAIVRDPEVFLMDEPLSNLDAKLRTQMRTELQNLQQELGVTTIYVTHDQTEAMTMGDRIAILDGGELQQVGSPLECYHRPANLFVAGFIGSPSMNVLDVERRGDALVHDRFTYRLPDDSLDEYADADGRLVLGIRPEDVRLVDDDAPNAVSTTVSVVEPMGNLTFLYFDIGDETYTASVDGDVNLEAGRELAVQFPEEKIHLFDSDTGRAVKHRAVTDDRTIVHSAE